MGVHLHVQTVETKNFTTVIVRNYPAWHSIECFLHAEMNHSTPIIHCLYISKTCLRTSRQNSRPNRFCYLRNQIDISSINLKVQHTFDDPITPLQRQRVTSTNICKRWPKSDRHVLKSVLNSINGIYIITENQTNLHGAI